MSSSDFNLFSRVFLSMLTLNCGLLAQVNTGSISGYVLDPSAQPIPKVRITIENSKQGFTRTTIAGENGFYEFADLAPDEYRLSVNAPGVCAPGEESVAVKVDQRVQVNLQTALAVRNERVIVNGQTPLLSAGSSALGEVLDQKLIDSLPLNERDFLQLAFLLPGVAPPVQDSALSTRGTFAMHAERRTRREQQLSLRWRR